MSDRDDNRTWLRQGAERDPDGWEAGIMADFGEEGALDILALQGGPGLQRRSPAPALRRERVPEADHPRSSGGRRAAPARRLRNLVGGIRGKTRSERLD